VNGFAAEPIRRRHPRRRAVGSRLASCDRVSPPRRFDVVLLPGDVQPAEYTLNCGSAVNFALKARCFVLGRIPRIHGNHVCAALLPVSGDRQFQDVVESGDLALHAPAFFEIQEEIAAGRKNISGADYVGPPEKRCAIAVSVSFRLMVNDDRFPVENPANPLKIIPHGNVLNRMTTPLDKEARTNGQPRDDRDSYPGGGW